MAYSTPEEVRLVLSGRTDEEDETADQLTDDQLEYAINSADAQIDLALRKRYTVPFGVEEESVVPALVKYLSIDIACYLTTMVFNGSTPVENDSPSARRYDRARRLLDDLRFGRVDLDAIEDIDNPDGPWGPGVVINPYDGPLFPSTHIFGVEYVEGFIPMDRAHL